MRKETETIIDRAKGVIINQCQTLQKTKTVVKNHCRIVNRMYDVWFVFTTYEHFIC